jgi:hypothetical protein
MPLFGHVCGGAQQCKNYQVAGAMRITTHIGLSAFAALLVSGVASADWTPKFILDPVKDETRCMLESDKKVINDGYQDTEIVLRIDDQVLLVATKSNIDTSKGDVGLKVDKHEFIKMDKLKLEQTVVFDKQIAKIVEQFKKGLRVALTLRFWPTYPSTGAKTVTFSLIGFTKAHGELGSCG